VSRVVLVRRALPSSRRGKERERKKKEREKHAHELQCNLLQRLCVTDGAEKCNPAMGLERHDSSATSGIPSRGSG